MQRALIVILLVLCPVIVSAKTVLVLGDSLSAAYNMKLEAGWVHLLSERLGPNHQVINASISGDTTAGGVNRLPAALKKHRPDIVILELDANDGLRGLSLTQMKRNLSKMIELSQISGAKVILAAMHLPPNYGDLYNSKFHNVYTELKREHNIVLIPFLLDQVGGVDDMIQADGLHPNEKAQPIILVTVWAYLGELLGA